MKRVGGADLGFAVVDEMDIGFGVVDVGRNWLKEGAWDKGRSDLRGGGAVYNLVMVKKIIFL